MVCAVDMNRESRWKVAASLLKMNWNFLRRNYNTISVRIQRFTFYIYKQIFSNKGKFYICLIFHSSSYSRPKGIFLRCLKSTECFFKDCKNCRLCGSFRLKTWIEFGHRRLSIALKMIKSNMGFYLWLG